MIIGVIGDYYWGGVGAIFYIIAYVILIVILFGIIFSIGGIQLVFLVDLQTLGELPSVFVIITGVLAAMAGVPPLLGFWGKLGIIIILFCNYEYFLAFMCLFMGLFLLYFYFQNYRLGGN